MSLKDTRVICFGEVLLDLFPNGAIPGGAPMNVAIHLQNFKMKSGIISRVGNDIHGNQLIEFLKVRNVNSELLQVDGKQDTGTVRVNVDKIDDPVYTIVEKVAWDFIDDSFLNYEINPKYLVFGSLACRSLTSNASLQKLLESSKAQKVFDLNVRTPHYSRSVIDTLLKSAHIIKMNMDEFKMLKEWFYIKNPREQGDFRALKSLYPNIETMILTKGGKGATVWKDGKMETAKANPITVKDTVGSGDAFLAAFLSQIDQGASQLEALQFATATGAYVATQEGANPKYTESDIIPLIAKS